MGRQLQPLARRSQLSTHSPEGLWSRRCVEEVWCTFIRSISHLLGEFSFADACFEGHEVANIAQGLPKVGILPNPDPADIEHFDKCLPNPDVAIDREYEASRGATRKQAQQWANLNIDESAELFVFVGRWSMQKGIDLIADVFPKVLEENPKAQLICVGPVIDLYGKFAALKLDYLMKKYPGRVYSKPMFVYVPPFVHAGAEFALIPSRDEPFGLVSVEFGRKGALGVGAKVGGLGQMPGKFFIVTTLSKYANIDTQVGGSRSSHQ